MNQYVVPIFLSTCFVALSLAQQILRGGQSPIVQTKSGPVQGRLISLSASLQVYEFLAIPFAEAPTGSRRFRKPVPKSPWTDTLQTRSWPRTCPQISYLATSPHFRNYPGASSWLPQAPQSEDCLYLNLWVPRKTLDALQMSNDEPPKLLSAFTFIHGGGFTQGATSIGIYNGTVLSAYNNIIVATIQYRVGALGFAYMGTEGMPGNMGLWDQMEGLKWICNNLAAFGGNCSEHTIGGESAGASSVTFHLLSPQSRQFFKRAIVQSGAATASWSVKDANAARAVTDKLIQDLENGQCRDSDTKVACLRDIEAARFPPFEATMSANAMAFGPVIDGDFVPRHPVEMLASGNFYRVPLLIGANKDEGSMFTLMSPLAQELLPMPPKLTDQSLLDQLNFTHYNLLLKAVYSANMPNADPLILTSIILHYWPRTHEGYPYGQEVIDAVVQAAGDVGITCPTFGWAQLASAFGKQGLQTYAYHFTHRRAAFPWPLWMGVAHGDELPFIFGAPLSPANKDWLFSYDDKMLSRVMMAQWTNFIKFGDPNIRDVDTVNIGYGPLQQRPWPTYTGIECPSQIVDMSAVTQVYNYGPGHTCSLKVRDCTFWSELFVKLVQLVMQQGASSRRNRRELPESHYYQHFSFMF